MCECNLINDINDNHNKSAKIKERSFLGRRFPASPSTPKGGNAYDRQQDQRSTAPRDYQSS